MRVDWILVNQSESVSCYFNQSRAKLKLIVTGLTCIFPRLASVGCFPALGACWVFSRAWRLLDVLPRLSPVRCFPAVTFAPVGCFPGLSLV